MANIWRVWQVFSKGKRRSGAITAFYARLESNLLRLQKDLQAGNYRHQGYESFVVHDPKRREIAVASVRDRVVHRLFYEYLVTVWDKSFCYDAWSCRRNKGLLGAINRAQSHAKKYRHGWLWRSDITKFFDSVDQNTLQSILRTKTKGSKALSLLDEVINSYACSSDKRQATSDKRQATSFVVCQSAI